MQSDADSGSVPNVVIVVCDEAEMLLGCLSALGSWVSRTTVVDVGRDEASRRVADGFGCRVVSHRHVPYAEVALSELPGLFVEGAWTLRLDPDEWVNERLKADLVDAIGRAETGVGFAIPLIYYFKNEPLFGTPWGGVRHFFRLFRWGEMTFDGSVHAPTGSQFQGRVIDVDSEPVCHYWIQSWPQFFSKHWRYIRAEGPSRVQRGEDFSVKASAREIAGAAKHALWDKRDRRDGLRGVLLGLSFLVYLVGSWVSFGIARRSR